MLYKKTADEITDTLQKYIDNAPEPEAWQNANDNDKLAYKMAIKRLRTDIKMYDWISTKEEEEKPRLEYIGMLAILCLQFQENSMQKSPWIQKEHEWLIICATAMASFSMTKTKN